MSALKCYVCDAAGHAMESGPPLCKLHHKQFAKDTRSLKEVELQSKIERYTLPSDEQLSYPPITARKTDPIGYERRECADCKCAFYVEPSSTLTKCMAHDDQMSFEF